VYVWVSETNAVTVSSFLPNTSRNGTQKALVPFTVPTVNSTLMEESFPQLITAGDM
jgi:hypothetical protein